MQSHHAPHTPHNKRTTQDEEGLPEDALFPISAATGRGVREVVHAVRRVLAELGPVSAEAAAEVEALNLTEVPRRFAPEVRARTRQQCGAWQPHMYACMHVLWGASVRAALPRHTPAHTPPHKRLVTHIPITFQTLHVTHCTSHIARHTSHPPQARIDKFTVEVEPNQLRGGGRVFVVEGEAVERFAQVRLMAVRVCVCVRACVCVCVSVCVCVCVCVCVSE
jgi:hypothetical protein